MKVQSVVARKMSCSGASSAAGSYWPLDVEDLGRLTPILNNYPSQQQLGFAYCTDDRWLGCPDTQSCPLFAAEPLQSWRQLPCQRDLFEHYSPIADDEAALEQFLSNEKRKEKSRDAARSRRSRETDIFTELAEALPCPQGCPCPSASSDAQHLDKASVMRLAIAYLKTRTLVQAAVPKQLAKPEPSSDLEELLLQALDGFVLVLDNNGDMVYLTPNVKDYLGIAQMDLMGQSIYDYSHPCDHDEIRESFAVKTSELNHDRLCNFFLRLKCTLTSKGRKVNLKSASYKVLHCTGRLIVHSNEQNNQLCQSDESNGQEEMKEKEPSVSLVVVASPVPHPSNIEIPLGKYTFLSKHNLNMKFTYADDKLADFLGWESKELIGQSVFDFHHARDNLSLDKSFKSLFSKGQCETMAYRFLNKRGGYAWVVTQATLIHCSRLQKPLSVVCVNYLLSGVECEDEVYSVRQLEARGTTRPTPPAPPAPPPPAVQQPAVQQTPLREALQDKPVAVTASLFRSTVVPQQQPRAENKENDQPPLLIPAIAKPRKPTIAEQTNDYLNSDLYGLVGERPGPAPETATASIFAPRTKDMNKGFLTFSEDQPGLTMLKDEPEDLTHLAPTCGDVCVPLEEPPFLSDMLDEFMLNDSYCQSTNDGSVPSNELLLDPFICRRSDESETEPELESPKSEPLAFAKTPLDKQQQQLSEDEMLMMSISDVMADDELALRAPYIPMSDQDEALQLLISDDVLMWPAQPSLLLNSTPDEKKWSSEPPDDCISPTKPANNTSSLAQLLSNDYDHLKDRRATNTLDTMITADNSISNSHHNNKRPNGASPHKSGHESLSKRAKHNDSQPVSQLLQQLQQQSEPRALGLHQDDGGGRMDTTTNKRAVTTGQPPHSSSVLMNLLVSGCDMQAIQEELQRSNSSAAMAGLTQQPQHKMSELQMRIEDQLQTVPQWTNSLNSDSVSSINSCSPIPKNYDPINYDVELSFINSTDMLQDNELFSALDSSLL